MITPIQRAIIEGTLKQDEGFSLKKYNCSRGYATIGFGHRIRADENYSTISLDKAEALFQEDLNETIRQCKHVLADIKITGYRMAFICMAFQMGPTGAMAFVNMIDAMKRNNFVDVVLEMQDSKWAKQTPARLRTAISLSHTFSLTTC